MDSGIPPIRSDVVTVPSVARPTPAPVRVSFGDVLSKGANAIVSGAEAAMDVLPGGSLVAAAIRGGATTAGSMGATTPMMSGSMTSTGSAAIAEGPTSVGGGFNSAAGSATSTTPSTGSLDSSLQQSQEMNLYFLQIQQEVNAQNQTFTTLSNVMKSEADTIKNAIGNLR